MLSWLSKKQKPPTPVMVMRRVIILKHQIVKALATPPRNYLSDRFRDWNETDRATVVDELNQKYSSQVESLRVNGLWKEMTRDERTYMEADVLSLEKQQIIDASWLADSAMCLIWALGYTTEIPPYDQEANPEYLNLLPREPIESLVRSATLRPKEEISHARELAELWHWRARTRELQETGKLPGELAGGQTIEEIIQATAEAAAANGDIPEVIGNDFPAFGKPYRGVSSEAWLRLRSIAQERHRALNWLCGYAPDNQWDETPTDT